MDNLETLRIHGKIYPLSKERKSERSQMLDNFQFNSFFKDYLNHKKPAERQFLLDFVGYTTKEVSLWFFNSFNEDNYLELFKNHDGAELLLYLQRNNVDVLNLGQKMLKQYLDAFIDYYHVIETFNQRILYLINSDKKISQILKDKVKPEFFINFCMNDGHFILPSEYESFLQDGMNNGFSEDSFLVKYANDKRFSKKEKKDFIFDLGLNERFRWLTKKAETKRFRDSLLDRNFTLYNFFKEKKVLSIEGFDD